MVSGKMKVVRPWFSYSAEMGLKTHATEAEAMASAESELHEYREHADEGWPEGVESVCWGRLHGMAVLAKIDEMAADDPRREEGCSEIHEYDLAEVG